MQTKRTRLAGNRALGRGEDELRLPGAAERERECFDRFRDEPVVDPRSAALRDLDQPGFTQDSEVMRDRRLREAEGLELADAGVATSGEPVDDREPGGVRESLEPRGQLFELLGPQWRR